jgi:hypothetical protein
MTKSFQFYGILALIVFTFNSRTVAQRTIYEPLDISKVEFSFEDFGSMYTFDAVPLEKFKKKYNFVPDKAWLDNVQKSALQFGGGCSAAFVSADGLIMTNHHCIRGNLNKIQRDGENVFKDGFYAKTLADERIFPEQYVDQLIEIKDVTIEILSAMEKGASDKEKVAIKKKTIEEIIAKNEKETGLTCKIVTLYNGGKYSLYIYKRYTDIRLVMIPDVQITATGWDWDNFTYPRYELDFAFLRAYENGKPAIVKNFFKWSKNGSPENEAIFVVGRPGNTDRLVSLRELDFDRNVRSPIILQRYNELYQAYFKFFEAHPERHDEILSQLLSVANGRKKFAGELVALNDAYLMAKKFDFEKKLKEKVLGDTKLNEKYGNIWDDLNKAYQDLAIFEKSILTLNMADRYLSAYHETARNLVVYAFQMKMPESERNKAYKSDKIEQTKSGLLVQLKDPDLQEWLVISHADFLFKANGKDDPVLQKLFGGHTGKEAFDYFIKNTNIQSKPFIDELLSQGPDAILKSGDPLIQYYVESRNLFAEKNDLRENLYNSIEILNQQLGSLIFDAFGEQIPPDATSTLRISDGVIKQYEYNGTIAPGKVTFYGMYDRYFSFGQKDYPWGLHPRWKKPAPGLDLSIPVGFASTNDIVGGNSGSSVINKNAEIVGLIHDGNLESLAGSYAFLEENNRAVATDSWGLMEALKLVYKTDRLVKELQNSGIK